MKNINDVKLIGVHGPLDGGKDTTANWLQAKFPDRFGRYAFAQPLKRACMELFGFSREQLEDRVLKEQVDEFWGFTPRKAMQLLGTEYGRDMLRKDCWIRRGEMEYLKNLKLKRGMVITDVRFENEAEWIRAQPNAMLIYLVVPDLKRTEEKYQHASEAGIKFIPEFDSKVINDKGAGLAAFFTQLDTLFEPSQEVAHG